MIKNAVFGLLFLDVMLGCIAELAVRRSGYPAFFKGTKFNKLILNCKINRELYF
jgi:hypothetical protein